MPIIETTVKINRLALASLISGLIALLCIALSFLSYSSPGTTTGWLNLVDGIIIPLRNLCVAVALVTGVIALGDMRKNGGSRKDKIFAWTGLLLGAGWIIIAGLVGLAFLLGELLH